MILGFVLSWMHSDKSRQSVVWLYTRYFFQYPIWMRHCFVRMAKGACFLLTGQTMQANWVLCESAFALELDWSLAKSTAGQLSDSQKPFAGKKWSIALFRSLSWNMWEKNTYNIVILGVTGPGRPTTTDALFKSNLVHLFSRKLKVRLQSAPLLAQAAVASLTARSLAFSIYLGTSKLPLLLHLKQNNRMLDCPSRPVQGTSSMVTPDLVANGLRPRRTTMGMGIASLPLLGVKIRALQGACSGTFVISSRTTW